jgi:hypothetical protein
MGMKTPTQFTDIQPASAIHHASSLTVGLIEYLAGELGRPVRVIGPSNLKVCSIPATPMPAVIVFPLRMNGHALDARSAHSAGMSSPSESSPAFWGWHSLMLPASVESAGGSSVVVPPVPPPLAGAAGSVLGVGAAPASPTVVGCGLQLGYSPPHWHSFAVIPGSWNVVGSVANRAAPARASVGLSEQAAMTPRVQASRPGRKSERFHRDGLKIFFIACLLFEDWMSVRSNCLLLLSRKPRVRPQWKCDVKQGR